MSDYVLWYRGLRGPRITILRNRDPRQPMSQWESHHKIGDPKPISETDARLPLDAAAALYPCPQQAEE